ncbi:hypothetical protein BUALT_Bualt14G0079800 [Buddleja alternifolia]|uniref:F-box/LRR-repeat protein 15/At3g58940/PEG3-like LRR domain-containing protein n=1 Tax=Buddleja alternifolia TaxID=168488 RepID=A0AAV6WJ09_9LAMI|nr:hypothetical protein BUALT_Bualt14G0079800 [Buddleja alternifolia]
MERGKRSEAINGEIELPEAIIQQIQSLLNGKQAARTSVVSKSWYNAWLTSPNLDFDQRNFQKRRIGDSQSEAAERFPNFVKKTMKRYQELNLKIVKFRLWMRFTKPDLVSLANESIIKALKMGVNDLSLDFFPHDGSYVLPNEVLETESLIRLSAIECKIDRPMDRKVLCSRLESLSLSKVCVEDDVVWDIISSCPLIENLLLSECNNFVGANKFGQATWILSLRSPVIDIHKGSVGSIVDGPIKVLEFHKLKSLFLQKVSVDGRFFSDFSINFPCIEDLSLHNCYGYLGRAQISSHSLKSISLTEIMMWVNFDVPNISKFTFTGTSFSRLSFTSALKECESHISILFYCHHVKASWFRELKRFLTMLTPSKISLSLGFFREQSIDRVREYEGLPRPVLENLILSFHVESSVDSAFLDGLFWSCRPKVITINGCSRSRLIEKAHNELIELLCKRLIQQVNQNCCISNQNVFGQHGLKEVNMEYFEETGRTTLFCASTSPQYGQKVRFRLKWGRCDCAGG